MDSTVSTRPTLERNAGGNPTRSQKLTRNNYIRLRGAGMDWTVHRRLSSFVEKILIPNWSDLTMLPNIKVVKANAHRSVYKVDATSLSVYVKQFRLKTLMHRLKALIVPGKAKTEWKHALRMYNSGVSTAQPAFVAENRVYGRLIDSTVGFFEVPHSMDYHEYLDQCRENTVVEGIAERRALLHSLAELTFQLFASGALHYDFHLGNVLVDGAGQLYVIDLDAVRFVPRVFRQQKLQVLAKMALSHAPFDREKRHWARDEVLWYCESYSRLDQSFGTTANLHREVLDMAWNLEQQRLRSRDKRCLVSSTLYEQGRIGPKRSYYRRAVTRHDLDSALKAKAEATLHQNSRGCVELVPAPESMRDVLRELRGHEPSQFVVRKTSMAKNQLSLLGTAFTGSKGMRSWRAARGFEVRHIPTALHVALVEERTGKVMSPKSVVFMEHLEHTHELHKYLESDLGPYPGKSREHFKLRNMLIEQLSELLIKAQETGISHHDLAVQNVLVRPIFQQPKPEDIGKMVEAELSKDDKSPINETQSQYLPYFDGQLPAKFELFLVDLDSVKLRRVRAKDLIRNLVHLGDLPDAAVLRDKLRFLNHYLRNGGQELLKAENLEWTRRSLVKEVDARWRERRDAKARRMAKKAVADKP